MSGHYLILYGRSILLNPKSVLTNRNSFNAVYSELLTTSLNKLQMYTLSPSWKSENYSSGKSMFSHTSYVLMQNRGSIVGIATGYGLDDQGVGVRAPVGARILSSPCRPDRPWSQLAFYPWLFPGGKEAGAWSWPLTSKQCRRQENADLYIHSPIRLPGVVLN
jgi:hypothetical protein